MIITQIIQKKDIITIISITVCEQHLKLTSDTWSLVLCYSYQRYKFVISLSHPVTYFLVQYLSAVQKYSEALKYACNQPKFRNNAFDIAKEKNLLEFDPKTGKPKKKQKSGVDLESVITSIIEENISVSGGYKKASLKDTLAWKIILSPVTLPQWIIYRVKLLWKKYHGKELTKEDKEYLICSNLGITHDQYEVHFVASSQTIQMNLPFQSLEHSEQELYFEREIWDTDACAKYKKEKEVEEKEKLLNSGRYKQYKRFMRRNAGNTISFLDE